MKSVDASRRFGRRSRSGGYANTLRFRQLYHDREEVTGYCAVTS